MNNQTEKRERGTGSIFLRENVVWIQYSQRGVKVRESTGIKVDESNISEPGDKPDWQRKAEKILRKKIGEVEAGIHHDLRQLRYEDLRDAFVADYKVNRRKSLRFDQKGEPYLDKVKRLDDFFGGYRASDVDADLVRKFEADQQGRGLSNGSINRSISALRRMFNLAAEDGKLRNVPHFPMLKEAAPRQGFFEPQTYEALSRELPGYLRLPLAIGYFTGMRLGEILGLQWSQIDFLAGAINLRAGETKNDEGRTVPIVPQLRALLLEQRSRRQAGCELVCFRLDRRGHAMKLRGFRKAWYSACVRTGLGRMEPVIDETTGKPLLEKPRGLRSKPKPKMVYRGTIFHDLRRTGVRNLVRAGVPERIAMEISGHRTRAVFERYNIVSPNDVAEAGRKLAEFHSQKFGHNSDTVSTETQQGNFSSNTM